MLQTISQIALCLLLILTTVWCVIVHRKLSHLRHEEGPLRELVQALGEAAAHADQTIADMRATIRDADRRAVALHELTQRVDAQTARARTAQREAPRAMRAEEVRSNPPRPVDQPRGRRPQSNTARKPAEARPANPGESARVNLTPDGARLAKSIECLR